MNGFECLKDAVDLSGEIVQISVSTVNILRSSREVQAASTSMAAAVEQMAASIEEIEGVAQQTSKAVSQSTDRTSQGVEELAGLRAKVAETGQLFETVSVKTRDVQAVVASLGQVVDLIAKIAGQTNMLALNATIEAARAGDHGRGFAVVAGEVKNLSRQTSEATETIRRQITSLSDSFAIVLETVARSQHTMGGVIQGTEQVSADFAEISRNSFTINGRMNDLAGAITQQRGAIQLLARNMEVVKDRGAQNLQSVEMLADETDRAVALIEDVRTRLAEEDIPNKVIYLAKADHVLWKKKLLDIAVGRVTVGASSLSDHKLCRLGKWYYSQNSDDLRSIPAFEAIEVPHQQVHFHGIEAAKCFEAHALDQGMEHYRQLEQASSAVVRALNALAVEVERRSRPVAQVA